MKRIHGLSTTPTYGCWINMMHRCYMPKYHRFEDYGGRGITVCDRWKNFENFLADMGPRPAGLSIERLDNEAGYSSNNCVWADRSQQQNNTRANHVLTFNGIKRTLTQWARQLDMDYRTLHTRIVQLGWPIDQALSTPVRKKHYAKRQP